jgi:hypothetical protein
MPTPDYSIGFSVAEVEEILSVHKAELKKTLASWSDSGSSVTRRRIDEIHAVIAACQDALRILAPDTYAPRRRIAQSHVISIPK